MQVSQQANCPRWNYLVTIPTYPNHDPNKDKPIHSTTHTVEHMGCFDHTAGNFNLCKQHLYRKTIGSTWVLHMRGRSPHLPGCLVCPCIYMYWVVSIVNPSKSVFRITWYAALLHKQDCIIRLACINAAVVYCFALVIGGEMWGDRLLWVNLASGFSPYTELFVMEGFQKNPLCHDYCYI